MAGFFYALKCSVFNSRIYAIFEFSIATTSK